MNRLDKDTYFLLVARLLALRSTCLRRAVGCVLTNSQGHVVATGYNGVPSGEKHCLDEPCAGVYDRSGDVSRCRAIHAEVNAINQIEDDHTLERVVNAYVTVTPCIDCVKKMHKMLPNLRYVCSMEIYNQEAILELQSRPIELKILPDVKRVSIDKLMAQMERFR